MAGIGATSTRAVVAARRGVDPAALLADFGIPEALLADPDARLPAPVVVALWADARRVVAFATSGAHLEAMVAASEVIEFVDTVHHPVQPDTLDALPPR